MRLSVPPRTEAERALLASGRANALPDPVYGGQLQDLGIAGQQAEGRIHTTWEEEEVVLGDGTTVSLRRPPPTGSRIPAFVRPARSGTDGLGPGGVADDRARPPGGRSRRSRSRAAADPDDADGERHFGPSEPGVERSSTTG